VCLRNDYEVREPVYNGSVWKVEDVENVRTNILQLVLRSDYESTSSVNVPLECRGFGSSTSATLSRCIRCRAANGRALCSSTNLQCSVVRRGRWLYTEITRAKERLTIKLTAYLPRLPTQSSLAPPYRPAFGGVRSFPMRPAV
jgi:hypothetical protein